ncbi:hypothetical protein I4641_21265 [Waterburya agarophytonicola K14]|uniref:Uncharacterized protein n=1 Tax=Waterburya agarophytonicola KI4 TaxID=2874699 RepID=A0A964BTQ5_9CYAN|nr:hypothetical protein [Waterburya agarophytonicola]MCC0179493.1 hypothetical protein [Waterburya agarophytonicola KI4]
MNKQEAIALLNQEGWTKADTERALTLHDFKSHSDINELEIRRIASRFAGAELLNRQHLQASQKGLSLDVFTLH